MGMIINPYRFQSAVWTPPSAVLWYYGSLLSGSNWADRIGSNHGTFKGGASAAADGVECSAKKYVTAASAGIETLVAGGNVLCVAIWAKYNAGGTLVAKDGYYQVNEWAMFTTDVNPEPDRLNFSMGQDIYQFYSENLGNGNWVHIAGVYDKLNSRVNIYRNGTKVSTTYSGTPVVVPSNSVDMIVGKNCLYVDDVIISTTAWSDDDVLDIYNNSPATHKP